MSRDILRGYGYTILGSIILIMGTFPAVWTGKVEIAVAAMICLQICLMLEERAKRKVQKNREMDIRKKETVVQEVMENITEERKRQEQDVRWFRSVLSHNVRMPLAIISGYGDLLRKGLIKEEKKAECLDKICGNITYLSNIVSLVLNSEEYKALSQEREKVDLAACIYEVTGYIEGMAKKAGIQIQIHCPQENIEILADYTQMMRVFYNLYENSFKYMKREGIILITIEVVEEQVLIIYKDNGLGMKQSEVVHMFDCNYQGSNSQMGSGLGMYFVKEVMEYCKGTVEAKSNIGKGMCVYMRIPVIGSIAR